MRTIGARALLLGAILAVACGGEATPVPTPPLGGSTVAVVGAVAIDASLVGEVARRKDQTPRQALDALVEDALAAQGAHARNLDATPQAHQARRAVLARLVTDRLRADALAKGPPTDAEIREQTERHWRDVDAPELAHAVHVVVMNDKEPAKRARAREVAEALHKAVLGATSAQDFISRASTVDKEGLDVRPQLLPDFAADGRAVDGSHFDAEFVKAAFALAPGETSGVIPTQFGLHVIRMFDRIPPKHVPVEERRTMFFDDVIAQRAWVAYKQHLTDLKAAHRVEIDSAAETLMAEVSGAGAGESK